MSNETFNYLSIFGTEGSVVSARAAVEASDELGSFVPDEGYDAARPDCPTDRIEGYFVSVDTKGFETVRVASGSAADLVFQLSIVDGANGFAESRVYRNGDEIGVYEMPQDEFEIFVGDPVDPDESALCDVVHSATNAYAADAVAELAARLGIAPR